MKKFIAKTKNILDSTIIKALYGNKIQKTVGDSHFLSVMVTIIIVLVIAVMYRKQVTDIFTDFFTKASSQITGLFPTP